ncbi:MAG: glycosyltransferase [Thalassobaculum sp.]
MSEIQSSSSDPSALPPLSVIVPVCDEAGAIAPLLREVLDKVGAAYRVEVVVVDDGSRDGTDRIVADLAAQDSRVTLDPPRCPVGQECGAPHRRHGRHRAVDGDH